MLGEEYEEFLRFSKERRGSKFSQPKPRLNFFGGLVDPARSGKREIDKLEI